MLIITQNKIKFLKKEGYPPLFLTYILRGYKSLSQLLFQVFQLLKDQLLDHL